MAGRIIGIDYGESRIGVAMSDITGMIATAFETVPCRNEFKKAVARIAEIIAQNGAETAVVGWPLNMNGTSGSSTEKVQGFIEALTKAADGAGLNLEIVKWDERLSTVEAHRTLKSLEVPGSKKRGIIDRMAAQVILQNFLDSRFRPG